MAGARLDSVDDVVKALGGAPAVRKLTGYSPQTVWNWRRANRFPASTYVLFQGALTKAGRTADSALWGQRVAKNSEATTS